MNLRRTVLCVAGAILAVLAVVSLHAGTLRIVSYNVDCSDEGSDNNIIGAKHSLPTVLQGIGLHHIGANAQPMDVMTVEELTSTTLANFVAQLNAIHGAGTYSFDSTNDPNGGGGPDGLIYDTQTVQVVAARSLPLGQTVLLQPDGTYVMAHSAGGGTNGVVRAPLLYQLRPIGYGSGNDFYVYVSHARSTSDNSVGDARYAEAQEVRSDAKYNLPQGAHIIYAGDWNLFKGSGENAYKCLTGQTTSDGYDWSDVSNVWANQNQTQGFDPTSKTAPPTTTTWGNISSDNASYLYGDSTTSLTSRIDIQLVNAPMLAAYNNQGGVQLAADNSDPYDVSNFPSSQYPFAFEVFGNDGTTSRSAAANSPTNQSLTDLANTTPNAATVYADLVETGSGNTFNGSDHYPIVGDYNIVVAVAPQLVSVVSRLSHGDVGVFDIAMPLTGSSGVEPRLASTYSIVLTFDQPVTSGGASVINGTGTVGVPVFSGNSMTVPLTGIVDSDLVTLQVTNVNGLLPSASVTLGFLLGDVNGDRFVNGGDAIQVRAQAGATVDATNFRDDLNLDGFVNAGDATIARKQAGNSLP